jgi:biotin carboxyl carrier protein
VEQQMKYITTVNDKTYEIEINQKNEVLINGEIREVDFHHDTSHGIFSLIIDNQSFEVVVEEKDDRYHILISGSLYEVEVTDERTQRLARATGGLASTSGEISIRSPMPGTIVAVPVQEGDAVSKGQTIVILESMKMENELKAPRDGVISRVNVDAGDSVEQNKLLVSLT